jgi:hypothetical protein
VKNLQYIILCSLIIPFLIDSYDGRFLNSIHNEVINSFEYLSQEKNEKPMLEENGFINKIKSLWARQKIKVPSISDREKLEIAFAQMNSVLAIPEKSVIDFEVINKFEILQGSNQKGKNLIRQLTTIGDDKNSKELLHTTLGLKVMAEFISMPTTSVTTIQNRQTVIKELVSNQALRSKCISLLQRMEKVEPYLYTMYAKDGLMFEESMLYPGRLLKVLKLDEVPAAISIANLAYAASPLSLWGFVIAADILIPEAEYFKRARNNDHILQDSKRYFETGEDKGPTVNERNTNFHKEYLERFKNVTTYWQRRAIAKEDYEKFMQTKSGLEQYFRRYGFSTVCIPFFAPHVLTSLAESKSFYTIIRNMQEKLINVVAFFKAAEELLQCMSDNSLINNAMPLIKDELAIYTSNKYDVKRFQQLIKLLNTKTFAGPNPSFFSSSGTILIAYKLFSEKETRSYFSQILQLIGEIDVYVALAQKVKMHENLNAKFCFVQFDQESKTPYIKAEEYWNPFIPVTEVITNSLYLNTGNEQNILLTGPNMSGKSTFLKMGIINIIMAQTFGISAAQSFTLTPFSTVLSYLNITDNIIAGASQFKAEVLRAEMLAKTITQLNPYEFAFIIVDEMFTGTAPTQAEAMSYNFMKHLSTFKNVLFINATHFDKLTNLEHETNGIVKNYHMSVDVNDNGKVTCYTRKLVPGKAIISSAEQVATESGILNAWVH